MSLAEEKIKVQIERIHRNKHNMIPVVRLVVLQPIDCLMQPDALSSSVPDDVRNHLPIVKRMADSIMNELKNLGSTQSDNLSTQLLQLEEQISSIEKQVIPKIIEIVSFYSELYKKRYYFTVSGETARKRIFDSKEQLELVCNGLQTLNDTEASTNGVLCVLFQLVERAFDGTDYLDANIEYLVDDRSKSYNIILDENLFSQKVLSNIKWNIQSHAFPKNKYKNTLITKKIVRVKIEEENNFVRIIIDNNGEPFEGDATKVFDYGYCYGPSRHTGLGLNSAKLYMKSIGGDLAFQPVPESDFKVKYEITIKKSSNNV